MSWKPEVKVGGKWNRNALVFATRQEAYDNAYDLFNRWTVCENYQAVEVNEPINYKWVDGKLEPIQQ